MGYGNMGKGYAKTLSSLNIPFDYYDPPLGKDKFADFTHAIITTPISKHYESYNIIKNYINDENIMIIKPVAFLPNEISLLNKNIFFGMSERYNDKILKLNFNYNYIEFNRFNDKCDGYPLYDLGIHDLDIFFEKVQTNHTLTEVIHNKNYYKLTFLNENQKVVIQGGIDGKMRSITTGNVIINLIGNVNYHQQIKDFIGGKQSNAKKAHLFLSNLYNLFHTS